MKRACLMVSVIVLLAFRLDSPLDLEKAILDKFQPVHVAHLPTPLEGMKTLSSTLGGPQIYIKRDDQTGLAFGGNKARKLEFIFADVLAKKSDTVVTWAGVQSNWARQTAAAAVAFGLKPILVLSKTSKGPVPDDGNLLIDRILDAEVHFVEPGEDRRKIVDRIVAGEKQKGRRPYVVSVGGSRVGDSMTQPLGSVAYAMAFYEIQAQAKAQGIDVDHIVLASGSGSTQAGLVLGAKAMGADTKIVGISVSGEKNPGRKNVSEIANLTAEALDLDVKVSAEEVILFDDYIGEGYGVLNQGIVDTIALVARNEGILLDPVYTGKAMAGMIDLVKKGYFKKEDTVVFIHTGGTPALFVYKEQIMKMLQRGSDPTEE